ncbi:hypothetical protein H0H93_007959 [Arthromyces matolae]|nr:hypothetical protein H0H93_007959 [Arthromyces matolae]
MARPRKYHNPEEERLARNARSRRSYAKHQTSIRERRSKLYHKEKSAVRKDTETNLSGSTSKVVNRSNEQNVAFWLRKAGHIDAEVTKLMGGGDYMFFEGVLERYLEFGEDELSNTIIEDASGQFDKLSSEIQQCQHAILQLAGVDKEWFRVEEMVKRIDRISKYLNDMNVYTLLPAGELRAAHKRRELMYQVDN